MATHPARSREEEVDLDTPLALQVRYLSGVLQGSSTPVRGPVSVREDAGTGLWTRITTHPLHTQGGVTQVGWRTSS